MAGGSDNERRVERLTNLLKMWRGLVDEGDVPRYTITPGAALNTLVTWTDQELRGTK